MIGLGSNMSNPKRQVQLAIETLSQNFTVIATSSLYQTSPVGEIPQDDFINAVVAIETELSPQALLVKLLALEKAQGRRRDGTRWGPRIIDLDILLYGNEEIDEVGLKVPHPELLKRSFVLTPLLEIAPKVTLPNGRSIKEIVQDQN